MEPNSFESAQANPKSPSDPDTPSSDQSAPSADSEPATPPTSADSPPESTPSDPSPPPESPESMASDQAAASPASDTSTAPEAPSVEDAAESARATPPTQSRLWLPVIAVNVLIVAGVAIRVFSDPNVGNLQAYEFPETIEIEGWRLTDSEPIEPVEKPEYEGSSYRAGRHYRYRQGGTLLDVEIRYVTETLGGVDLFTREHERFIGKADGEAIVALIRQSPETGAFAQLTYDDYAYISTCINPRGLSTVSPEQFQRNQELYDTVMGRVIPWLLGRDRWRDDRCLWTLMYSPLGDDPDQTQDQLEAAWRDWFATWEGQFPPL